MFYSFSRWLAESTIFIGNKTFLHYILSYRIKKTLIYCSKGLAHGNLNPNTVLLAYSIPRRVKISEFGLTNSIDFSSATDSVESDDIADEPSHKNKWDPQYKKFLEVLSHPKYWKRTSTSAASHDGSIPVATVHGDVFAAGCLFFYLLTQGSHPFGSPKQILANISESRPINLES